MTNTRDQIIEKTCELLELQGYHATGLNQILRESGSPKGSLYYHFPGGKEELAVESVERVGNIVLRRIRENLAAVDDPADAIQTFIGYVAYNVEQSGFQAGGPITTVALETAASSEALRGVCHHIYSDWIAAFAERLTTASINEERAMRLAHLIVATLEGGIILCRTSRSRQPLEDAAQEIAGLIRGVT
jgi:TetR/AcrR family transcriptional regulator, lmrAB and yxaGH operons repressor